MALQGDWKEEVLTDETIMTFGKYKGQKLCNIPDSYLIWLHSQLTSPGANRYGNAPLIQYIQTFILDFKK
jgi:uncharacterized protein (DUF3820 family)